MAKIKSYLPVFPGFYNTLFEANEDHIIEGDFSYDDYEFNYADYSLDMAKGCCNAIEAQLNELGFNVGIEFENVYSPREYNFTNDSINCTYVIKPGCITAIRKYLKANFAAFEVYTKGRFTSRSGFISFYSNDPTVWVDLVNIKSLSDKGVYLGTLFDFILLNEDYNSGRLREDRHLDGVYLDGWLKVSEDAFLEEFNEDDLYKNYEVLESGDFNILARHKETLEALYYYRVSSDCNMSFNMLCEVGQKYTYWFNEVIMRLGIKRLNGESDTDVFDILETINPNQLLLLQ
jgi:hypothetical protein